MKQDKSRDITRRIADANVRSAYYESRQDKRESLIDAQIRAAQEQGKFDNLPGFGKPLSKDAGYEMAGEHWMSNHILKQAGYLPIWLELRKEIASERGDVEAALAAYHEQALNPVGSSPTTLRQLEDHYFQLATAINQKIDQHNDHCPNTQLLNRFREDATRR
jgi:hypothetical protein